MSTILDVPGLTSRENGLLGDMLLQLNAKRYRNLLRQRYINSQQVVQQLGIAVPPQLNGLETVMGWPAKAVAILGRRINFDGIVSDGQTDPMGVGEIFNDNEIQLQAPQIQNSALSYASAFIAITPGDTGAGEPAVVMTPRSALDMTALFDRRTRRLSAALSVNRDNDGNINEFALFLPDRYVFAHKVSYNIWATTSRPNPTGRVQVSFLPYQPDLDRPFGRSKVSRAVMSLTDQAVRTMLRTEIAAEFFSVPQRYVMGANEEAFIDKDGNPRAGWEITIGNILALARDDDALQGDGLPQVGQFPQMSMQPHTEMLRGLAASFAGEANIPVNSLGIIHDNPASDAAMQTAYLDLVQDAESCHQTFGAGYAKAAQLAVMLRDKTAVIPDEAKTLRARFRNASTPTLAAQTQAVMAQVAGGVLPVDSEVTLEELGYSAVTIQRILSDRRRAAASNRLSQLRAAVAPGATPANQPATAPQAAEGA
jgi:hypothetical protein